MTYKGLIAYIYRDADNGEHDCTNGGVTAKYLGNTRVLVVGENIPEIFEDKGEMPVLRLEKGPGNSPRLVLASGALGNGPMFGGNFVYTSDSRFGEAVAKITGVRTTAAIPVHDRYEFDEGRS